jgi:hypothetical protein
MGHGWTRLHCHPGFIIVKTAHEGLEPDSRHWDHLIPIVMGA